MASNFKKQIAADIEKYGTMKDAGDKSATADQYPAGYYDLPGAEKDKKLAKLAAKRAALKNKAAGLGSVTKAKPKDIRNKMSDGEKRARIKNGGY